MNSLNILKMSKFRVQVSVSQKMGRCLAILLLVLGILFAASPAYCDDYYVAPDGNDLNDGSIDHPFKTIPKAVSVVAAGDNIFLRGGQHDYTDAINISTSGEEGNSITLQAYQDEVPILDFSEGSGRGIKLSGSYWHFKGFIIQKATSNGMRFTGSYNVIEQLVTRRNGNTGLHMDGNASNNLVVDCDSYLNFDPGAPAGEDADGFAVKSATIGPGNVFRRCRSWNNSDDGYDFWESDDNGVRLEDCWAFRNGENVWGISYFYGDGNGFKLGVGSAPHVLVRCVAYDNTNSGIDVNGNTGGVTVYNSTCVSNGDKNFQFDEDSSIHVLRNNISYDGVEQIYDLIDDANNSWNYEDEYGYPDVCDADFVNLDPNFDPIEEPNDYNNADSNGIDGPRGLDGSLPKLQFLHLSEGSWLIDMGIDVGEIFAGDAPDLGAFEHYLDGDCEPDGDIDWIDLRCLALNWLDSDCGECNGADFDDDHDVDLYDFARLAGNWWK